MTHPFGRSLDFAAPGHVSESDPVLELAGSEHYGRALDIASASGSAAHALLQLSEIVLIAAADRCLSWPNGSPLNDPPADVQAWLACPEWLPLRDDTVDLVVWHVAADHLHACRAGLDEIARVLVPGGTLIVVGVGPMERQQQPRMATRAPSAAAFCRVIEEHGFVVDTAVTTRSVLPGVHDQSAPIVESAYPSLGAPRVVCEPPRGRDTDLHGFAWPLTAVRSRKPGWRRYVIP